MNISTNKILDNKPLSFNVQFNTEARDGLTQIDTYLWDSANNSPIDNNGLPVSSMSIESINKLVHAVSIDWDNPSNCTLLKTLNNNNDIRTTDDIIFILNKLADIALNGNDKYNGVTLNALKVLSSRLSNEPGFLLSGKVNEMTNDDIQWEISQNTDNMFFIRSGASTDITRVNSTEIAVLYNTSKIVPGTLDISDLIAVNQGNKSKIDISWNLYNTSITWNSNYNLSNTCQIKASYQNADDVINTISSSDCFDPFILTNRQIQLSFTLDNQTINDEIFGINPVTDNTTYKLVDNEYFKVNKTYDNNGDIGLVFNFTKKIPVEHANVNIKIYCSAIPKGQTAQIEKTYEKTLKDAGFPVDDPSDYKNIGIYFIKPQDKNLYTENSNNVNNLFNNMQIYTELTDNITLNRENDLSNIPNIKSNETFYLTVVVPNSYKYIQTINNGNMSTQKIDLTDTKYATIIEKNNYICSIITMGRVNPDYIQQINISKN